MNGGCRGRGDDAQRPVGGEEGLLLLLLLLLQLLQLLVLLVLVLLVPLLPCA